MEPVIEVRGIGKKYNISHMQGGYVALRDVIANVFTSPLKFLTSKAKTVVGLEKQEEYWALRDANFKVHKGEIIGIIGPNGAGKSTLLKILSRITPPTEGEIIMRGSLGSLLEVGTGFHPELTGRENIFLNGAILGMSRREIARKFDQIVEFSGIAKFIDTPVKRYSSGMYVRLAFSVAAHMEPDILLIDEVLAVGDNEFQKKCLAKMEEITATDKRTILFVSHNMDAVRQLCQRTILLSHGGIAADGPTNEVIDKYLSAEGTSAVIHPTRSIKELVIRSITPENVGAANPWMFPYGGDITIGIEFETFTDIEDFQIGLGINSLSNETILSVHNPARSLKAGKHTVDIAIKNMLTPGTYSLTLRVLGFYFLPNFGILHIAPDESGHGHRHYNQGLIDVPAEFTFR